jgi:adenine deaminase
MKRIEANYVDIENRKIFTAAIHIEDGRIKSIEAIDKQCEQYILPGFVDAHIHIESSMLVPSEFAKIAVQHGTVGTISDPHEIANVCGVEGVQYMLRNAAQVPFHFCFGAPSCVPATSFETAGASINSADVEALLKQENIYYLSEVMNYPGVLHQDQEVMAKIAAAKKIGKPIDGHAPGLMGQDAIQYISAGISTDHECYTYEEALHKLQHGMKVLIREGSAAKNFEALHLLIPSFYKNMMFCCDDKHPDELLLHHINDHVKRAVAKGYNVFDVLEMACINPVKHYKMPIGLLQVGDSAEAIIVKDLHNFEILTTIIKGEIVFDNGLVFLPNIAVESINQFNCEKVQEIDFSIPYGQQEKIKVIEALEGQLITRTNLQTPLVENNCIVADVANDVLQISVINRYTKAPVANAMIRNFGLQNGAIASTVAHDCHNIVVIGVNPADMQAAANALIDCEGGISVANQQVVQVLALPIAGIMSDKNAQTVARQYQLLDAAAKQLGCTLQAPFMTMSFMALLVIPQLKLSDKGLFDGSTFAFVPL